MCNKKENFLFSISHHLIYIHEQTAGERRRGAEDRREVAINLSTQPIMNH